MLKIKWLVMLVAMTALACAPQYYSIGLPTAATVGQQGAPIGDGRLLAPCKMAGKDQGECVYYVNECDETGLHTITVQRVGKKIKVVARCVVPNAVVNETPATTADPGAL